MPHSPARWPPYGRPETSRLLKVDHYMLHLRMKMRSGGCAASSQNTDADRGAGGWSGVWAPGSTIEGPACLTQVCVQAILGRCPMCKVLRAVESLLRGYNDIQGGIEELWSIGGWGLA